LRSFFLDTSKGSEINLLLLEGGLRPASSIRKSNIQAPETGSKISPFEKERRRMLPLPDGYAYERKNLIHDRFFILMLLQAKACLPL